MVKKKIDNRIRVMIENGVKERHRTLFIIIGDKARDQVPILYDILTKSSVKARPDVLWCYKNKDEAISMLAEELGTPVDYVAAYVNNDHLNLNVDPYKKSVEKAWGYIGQLGFLDANSSNINIDDHINTELYKAALDQCVESYHDDDPDFYDSQLKIFEENNQ